MEGTPYIGLLLMTLLMPSSATSQQDSAAELAFISPVEKGGRFPAMLVKCADEQEPEVDKWLGEAL